MSTLPLPSNRSARAAVTGEPWWPRVLPRNSDAHNEELSLADYARLLRRWWWLATAVLAATLAGVAAVTFTRSPVYASEATVLIRTESSAQLFPLSTAEVAGRQMAAEVDFLASTRFLTEAEVAAGNDDEVTIDTGDLEGRMSPSVITFRAESPTPERAARTAEAWADTYIDLRHEIDLADLDAHIASLEATQQALTEERARVDQPLTDLKDQIDATDDASAKADLNAAQVELLQMLNPVLQPIDTELATVNTELAEQRLKAQLLENPEVSARINAEAEPDDSPVSPRPLRNLALALVIGSILAVGSVVAVASFDDRLRSTDDVEEGTGLGHLAVVPYTRNRRVPIELAPGSTVEEAFQRLVSSVDFAAAAGQPHQVLLITSPQPGEAKSSTAARLAIALAAQGRHVVVIGGDLRRPTLASLLGAADGPGLGDYLSDPQVGLQECLHRVEGRGSLVSMPAGQLRDRRGPAEVLRSAEVAAVIDRLREHCDHILIDGPPLLPVVDALELAKVSDAVVISLYAARSRRRALDRALRLLADAGAAPVLGYVLSGVQRAEERYGPGGY